MVAYIYICRAGPLRGRLSLTNGGARTILFDWPGRPGSGTVVLRICDVCVCRGVPATPPSTDDSIMQRYIHARLSRLHDCIYLWHIMHVWRLIFSGPFFFFRPDAAPNIELSC